MVFLVKFFPFILAWALVKGSIRKDKILFLQKSLGERKEMLLVITWTESEEDMTAGCEIFTDEGLINETLSSNNSQIRTLFEDEMQILLGDCLEFNRQRKKRDVDNIASSDVSTVAVEEDFHELSRANRRRSSRRRGSQNRSSSRRVKQQRPKSNKTRTTAIPSTTTSANEIEDKYKKRNRQNGSRDGKPTNREIETESDESLDTNVTTEPSTTLGYDGLPIIFPGTKWCGAGDIAKSFDDLGTYIDTDRCCRAHDLCNDTMAPGETKNTLTNTSPFYKLCCRCDEEFYNCLKNVDSITSSTIGNMFFNLLRRDCYGLDYPPSKTCKKYLTLFKLTCLEYEKDTSKEKVYQWIRPKRFPRA